MSTTTTSTRNVFSLLGLLSFLLLLASVATTNAQTTPTDTNSNSIVNNGVQSHFGDVSFAGGMAWDPEHGVVYVTGQVGPNGCFVGLLNNNFQWISKQILPEPAICQGVALVSRSVGAGDNGVPNKKKTAAVLLATTEEGGLWTDTRVSGSEKATQYGLVVDLQVAVDGQAATLTSGVLLHEDYVQYPRAIAVDPLHDNYVYVASMHSEDKTVTQAYQGALTDSNNNGSQNLTPGGLMKYGSAYSLTVERLRYDLDGKLTTDWRKPFGVHHSTGQPLSVEVATMIWKNGALLIVGTTRGSGPAFGTSDNEEFRQGFVTKLNPESGQLWESQDLGEMSVQRISMADDGDTQIESICTTNDDDNDSAVIYVVGMSSSSSSSPSSSIPFIAKLNSNTLEIVWQKELSSATTSAYGLACGVTSGTDNVVYMAGIIQDGGQFASQNTASLGNDDIFVAQFSTEDGSIRWVQQTGTSGNDRLAHGGSGLLVVGDDQNSNDNGVLLLGDTSGNWQSKATQTHELFVIPVGSDGSLPATTEVSGKEYNGGTVAILTPKRSGDDTTSDSDKEIDDTTTTTTPPTSPVNPSSSTTPKKGSYRYGMLVFIVVLAMVLVAGYVMQSRRQADQTTERALVFSYLQAFDVEDVDVRHSATGGWHGTYVGKLALGTESIHSSIVKDSLFVDYESKPKGGGDGDDDDDDDDDDDEEKESDTNWEDVGDVDLGSGLSYTDRRDNLTVAGNNGDDPWGKEII